MVCRIIALSPEEKKSGSPKDRKKSESLQVGESKRKEVGKSENPEHKMRLQRHLKQKSPKAIRFRTFLFSCLSDFFTFRLPDSILQVYHFTVCISSSFHNGFAHGWVRVYGFYNVVAGSFQFTCGYYFGNHFSNVSTNHVRA
jgi:hypothetical protein